MSSIELTLTQQTILSALIRLHRCAEKPVPAPTIATETDHSTETIRHQMQVLTTLDVVEGIPGPKGGYTPTVTAYDALARQQLDQPADVPVIHEGEPVAGTTVEEIALPTVHHPEHCRAALTLTRPEALIGVQEGDTLRIGPTPLSKLIIEDRIESVDTSDAVVSIEITTTKTPANGHPPP